MQAIGGTTRREVYLMGYDMWRHGGTYDERNRDRDYFRLNVWGMSEAREWLDKFGLLADAQHSDWPATPDGSWPDEEDVEPGSEWADYYAAHNLILAEHPNRDDPALPYYKLCSNDGWIVTPAECRAMVGRWRDQGGDGSEAPAYVKEFIAWIDSVSADGFEVH